MQLEGRSGRFAGMPARLFLSAPRICVAYCPALELLLFKATRLFCIALYHCTHSVTDPAGDRACLNTLRTTHRNDGRQHSSRQTHSHTHIGLFNILWTQIPPQWSWRFVCASRCACALVCDCFFSFFSCLTAFVLLFVLSSPASNQLCVLTVSTEKRSPLH